MSQVENFLEKQLELLKSEDPPTRSMAAEALMHEELTEDAADALCRLVTDSDKGVRNSADLALSINSSPVIPKYLVKYISSQEISVRNLAGEILLKIGTHAIDAMLKFIDRGTDDDKKFIVDILGLVGDPVASDKLYELLQTNKNDNVILACIEALGNLKYEDAVDYMIKVYPLNELFRPTIIESLGKIGTKKAVKFIIDSFTYEDELTKFSMIESLGLIGDEETFFFLLSELNKTEGPLVWVILNSIFQLKEKYNFDIPFDDWMKKAILNTIYEADSEFQKAAVNLILPFDDEEVINALLTVYGNNFDLDDLIKPKCLAKSTVTLILLPNLINKNPQNIRNLLDLLKEMVIFENIDYKGKLTSLQFRDLTEAVSNCLDNPDEEVRKSATELLFFLDNGIAVLFIEKMVEDDNMWNRLKLLELIDGVHSSKVDFALQKLANDPEEMISERAQFIISQRENSKFETKIEN